MKVLMFGWEFPPNSSGGLGTACYGLTKGLSRLGTEVIFVVPYAVNASHDFLKVVPANVTLRKIDSLLQPYMTPSRYNSEYFRQPKKGKIYGKYLFEEVKRYTELAGKIAEKESYDIIHCHDWMTFLAGKKAKEISGKPLVVHVHATEFDRTGGNGINQFVYDTEREGLHAADKIIAVSNFTKQKVVEHYGIDPDKVKVVHNAVEQKPNQHFVIEKKDKIVLFLGRVTLQKGPDYFLYAAKRALEIDPNIKFIIAGTGDMERALIEKSAELGISNSVLFSGFLEGEDVTRAYHMADLYVMPSVSEPFGITALEAVQSGTPIIISKQSGVSEVLHHCLKVDFWDIDAMADKIISVLKYQTLHDSLKEHGLIEVKKFNWNDPAKKCIKVYNEACSMKITC